jgi:hypothetical protein
MFTKSKRKGTPRRWKTIFVLFIILFILGSVAYWLVRKPVESETIVYLKDDNLWRIPFEGQTPPEQLTNFTEWGNTIWEFDMSFDGRYAVMQGSAGKWINLLDLDSGEMRLVRDCEAEGEDCASADFNPERNVIVYTYGTHTAGSVWAYDVEMDTHTRLDGVQGLYADWLDGQHLMYSSWEYENLIYNIETNTTIRLEDLGIENIASTTTRNGITSLLPMYHQAGVKFTPVVTVSLEGVRHEVDLRLPPPQAIVGFDFTELWSPDSSKVTFATATPNNIYSIIVQDVATGETNTLAQSQHAPSWMYWNADGTRLLVTRVRMAEPYGYDVVAYDLNTGATAVIEGAKHARWQL